MARAHARTLLPVFVRAAELIPRSLPRDRLEKLLSATWVSLSLSFPSLLALRRRGSEGQIEKRDFPTKPRLPDARVAKERSVRAQNKLPSRRIIHGVSPFYPSLAFARDLSNLYRPPFPAGHSCKTRSSRLKYNAAELLLLGSRGLV